jgi:muramoyltetrapeptide carboxypeptidase
MAWRSAFVLLVCFAAAPVWSWRSITKPRALALQGTTVALFSPASPYSYHVSDPTRYVHDITANLTALYNTNVVYGPHMSDVFAYLAGTDDARSSDVNALFAATNVQWMLANRGGYGCPRIVDMLDYNAIANNPKIIMGYSDLTALLTAIHLNTGLVTFHGPMGIDTWINTDGSSTMNADYVHRVLFHNQMVLMKNPNTTTLVPGRARGRLLGGNLSLFVAMLSTPYMMAVPWEEVLLFLEDVGEEPYHIDRMLTTLHVSGVMKRIAGFVWGTCTACHADDPTRSFTIAEVLAQKAPPCPSFTGLLFGHNGQQYTIPIGIHAELDADNGSIQLLEPALQ